MIYINVLIISWEPSNDNKRPYNFPAPPNIGSAPKYFADTGSYIDNYKKCVELYERDRRPGMNYKINEIICEEDGRCMCD